VPTVVMAILRQVSRVGSQVATLSAVSTYVAGDCRRSMLLDGESLLACDVYHGTSYTTDLPSGQPRPTCGQLPLTLPVPVLPAATSRFAAEANAATFARGQNTAERRSDSEIFQTDPGRTGAIYTAGAAAVDPASTLTGASGNSSAVALGVDGEGGRVGAVGAALVMMHGCPSGTYAAA
jgi:hypothetical protein